MSDEETDAAWKMTIAHTLENLTKVQQDTALLVERLTGRVTASEASIADLKNSPKNSRDMFATALQAGGCLGTILFACLSMISITITVVMAISQHWH